MNPKAFVQKLEQLFEANRDEQNAVPMKRYMRDQFEYFGIKSPLRKELLRQFLNENGKPSIEDLQQIVQSLWDNPHREMQYVAMDIMQKLANKLDESFLPFLEKLILQKSWWDTVDWLAPNGIGRIFQKHPQQIKTITERWVQSDNFWLQRSSIIFQLKYREQTDQQLIFDYILYRAESREFFIRKASGWALRQYSKYNAKAVIEFIQNHEDILSNLTKKEGLKWLERNSRR
jgi:3-methyladenine DNA glycosylase AlkD